MINPLKRADPTLLKQFASNSNLNYALAYLNKLKSGHIAKKGNENLISIDDMQLKYDVKVDDPNYAFLRRMARSHKDVAEISIPSLWERFKFNFNKAKDSLLGSNETKALEEAKETSKDKEPEVKSAKETKKPGELSPEEKKEMNAKITRKMKRKEEDRQKRLKMSQEDFRASLDEEDLAMYDALTSDKERIAFREAEPNMRYKFANREESEPSKDIE